MFIGLNIYMHGQRKAIWIVLTIVLSWLGHRMSPLEYTQYIHITSLTPWIIFKCINIINLQMKNVNQCLLVLISQDVLNDRHQSQLQSIQHVATFFLMQPLIVLDLQSVFPWKILIRDPFVCRNMTHQFFLTSTHQSHNEGKLK